MTCSHDSEWICPSISRHTETTWWIAYRALSCYQSRSDLSGNWQGTSEGAPRCLALGHWQWILWVVWREDWVLSSTSHECSARLGSGLFCSLSHCSMIFGVCHEGMNLVCNSGNNGTCQCDVYASWLKVSQLTDASQQKDHCCSLHLLVALALWLTNVWWIDMDKNHKTSLNISV